MADLRKEADDLMHQAGSLVMAAFGMSGKRPWRFAPEVEAKAFRLVWDLATLVEKSPIYPNRAYQEEQARKARATDADFVSFMYQLTARDSRGAFVGRRANRRCRG